MACRTSNTVDFHPCHLLHMQTKGWAWHNHAEEDDVTLSTLRDETHQVCLIPWKTWSTDVTPPLPTYQQVPHPLKYPEYWPHHCPPTGGVLTARLPTYHQVPHPLKDPEYSPHPCPPMGGWGEYWPHTCPPTTRCLIPRKTQNTHPTPAHLPTGASSKLLICWNSLWCAKVHMTVKHFLLTGSKNHTESK